MKNKQVIPVTKKDRKAAFKQTLSVSAWMPYLMWNKKRKVKNEIS